MMPGQKARLILSVALLLLTTLCGCSDTQDFEWRLRFADDEVRLLASSVTARILRGSCSSTNSVYEERLTRDSVSPTPPLLDADRYCFQAFAYSVEEQQIASGETEREMPADGNLIVTVLDSDIDIPTDADADSDADFDEDAEEDADEDEVDADEPIDAEIDEDLTPPEESPTIVAPWNGVATGSVLADPLLVDPTLRPEVRWSAVAEASSYVLEMVACEAVDLSECDFSSPTARVVVDSDATRARPSSDLPVSTTVPVGDRYALRVGACGSADGRACSYSDTRYIDVGRVRQDIDGDGIGDLFVIGREADGESTLWRNIGPAGGVVEAVDLGVRNVRSVGWIGDYDGDGIGELAVGADGAAGGRMLFIDDVSIAGSVVEDDEGANLAALICGLDDVDCDGYMDFAATVPGEEEVRIQLGGPTFRDERYVLLQAPVGISEFPLAIASAGDRDGDGCADLAVTGRLATGIIRVEVYSFADRVPTNLETYDVATDEIYSGTGNLALGRAVDIDDDGIADVAVGRRLFDDVRLFFADGFDDVEGVADELFGASLAGGDLLGTGVGLLAVGAPSHEPEAGMEGSVLAVGYDGSEFFLQRLVAAATDGAGYSIATVDLDGDGREDIAARGSRSLRITTFSSDAVDVSTTTIVTMPSDVDHWHDLAR